MLTYKFIEAEKDQSPLYDDYTMVDFPSGPIVLYQGSTVYGSFNSVHDVMVFIRKRMEIDKFWPDVWYQNERGYVDLCKIVPVVKKYVKD